MLNEDQTALKDHAERFAQEVAGPAALRRAKEGENGLNRALLGKIGENGWFSLLTSDEQGGTGLGYTELCLVSEAFGAGLLSLPYAAVTGALRAIGGKEEFASGEKLIVPVLALSGNRTSLKASGSTITGAVKAIPMAQAADAYLVATENLVALLPKGHAGISLTEHRAVDGTSITGLSFDKVSVPDSAVIAKGADAAQVRREILLAIDLGQAAELIGLTTTAINVTTEYMKTRTQFGKTISSFQALQHMAVDCYMQNGIAHCLVLETARLADEGAAQAGSLAAAARAKATDAALQATKTMIQLHGAIGFTEECDIGLYLKRALTVGTSYGTAKDHRRRALAGGQGNDRGRLLSFRADSPEDAAFRQEVRDWLQKTLPKNLRNLPIRPSFEEARWWHKQLVARGWIAPHWPKEYGGMGATLSQRIILADELAAAGSPEMSAQAVHHIGPTLIEFGTPEQKAKFLPGMLSGDVIWAQGYSEPNAGSDLSSLRTTAIRDGDHYVVNGSKIWTTWAHYADWMFALVRTNPGAARQQEGISLILIDLKSAGITRRPILTITGEDELAEVFMDNVRVPVENLVGKENDGWRLANALLAKERFNGANPQRALNLLAKIHGAAAGTGVMDDPIFRERLAAAEIEIAALSATFSHLVSMSAAGKVPGAEFSHCKIFSSELQQSLCDLLVEASGDDAAIADPMTYGEVRVDPSITWLQNRRATIFGGTMQIQRNIVAKQTLGLK